MGTEERNEIPWLVLCAKSSNGKEYRMDILDVEKTNDLAIKMHINAFIDDVRTFILTKVF